MHWLTTQNNVATERHNDTKEEIEVVDDSVRILYKMISKVNSDLSIIPVQPELILSTDDNMNYNFEGKCEENDVLRLVGRKVL